MNPTDFPFRLQIFREHIVFPPNQHIGNPVSLALQELKLWYTSILPYRIAEPLRIIAMEREPDPLKLAGYYAPSNDASEWFHEYLNGGDVGECDLLLSTEKTPGAEAVSFCHIVERK